MGQKVGKISKIIVEMGRENDSSNKTQYKKLKIMMRKNPSSEFKKFIGIYRGGLEVITAGTELV